MFDLKKITIGILFVSVAATMSGCVSRAAKQPPIDIVNEVVTNVQKQYGTALTSEEQKRDYTILLDGVSDKNTKYFLYDLTGDSSAELLMGTNRFIAYSYSDGSVRTIGSLAIKKAYLSEQYGLIGYDESDGVYELKQYYYNGSGLEKNVLVSVNTKEEYTSSAAPYLEGATELVTYELSNRTPLR